MTNWTRALPAVAAAALTWSFAADALADTITVTKARIGCLDIQTDGNLTSVVAHECNGKPECSYKAPTPDAYAKLGVHAATRFACTQGMEILYRCGNSADTKTV